MLCCVNISQVNKTAAFRNSHRAALKPYEYDDDDDDDDGDHNNDKR